MDLSNLQTYFNPESNERLGQAAGLNPGEGGRLLNEGLPLQLNALADHARTPEGEAQIAQALESLPAFPSVDAALDAPDGADTLRQAGTLLAPAVLGDQAGRLAGQVSQSRAGGDEPRDTGKVQHLLDLSLPLLLSYLGQHGLTPANVGSALPPLLGGAAALAAVPVVETVASAVNPPPRLVEPPPPPPEPVAPIPPPAPERRRGFPWWILPLLLLGGCWLLQPRPAVPPAVVGTPVAADLVITDPADGAEVPVSGFSMAGTGPAGETYQVFRDGNDVGTFTVDDDGNWNVDIVDAATEPGQQTYTIRTPDGTEVATLPVTAVATEETGEDATPAADLVITDPADGAEVPVSGFSMTGNGPAGETYQVFRDGNDVGTFTVGDDGNWNVDIVDAATEPGQQTYTVRTPDGTEVATLPVTAVAEDAAGVDATPVTPATSTPTPATPVPSATPALTITAPARGAQVPASGFSMRGTGPAGNTYQVFRDGQDAGTFTVGADGIWNVDIVPAATDVGQQTYTVRTPDGRQVAALPVTGQATTPQVDAAAVPTLPTVGIQQPQSGTQVPAAGFNLVGTGPAGRTFEVIEDDTNSANDSSLGSFTVAPDGNWTFAVPGPSTGPKTYVVRTPDGAELAAVPVTVQALATPVACTSPLTVSLEDGARVSAPFRFGGIGNAQSYTVTVRRGARVVGTQQVRLTPDCTWSYVSRPGGREGVESQVTYQVRPNGSADQAPARQLTLTITGSGVNFNAAGEYVGPMGQ